MKIILNMFHLYLKLSDWKRMKLRMTILSPHETIVYICHDCFRYKIYDTSTSTKVELFDFFTSDLEVNPAWLERLRYLDFLKTNREVISVVPEKFEYSKDGFISMNTLVTLE